MRQFLMITATVVLMTGLAGAADAQKLDKNGRCVTDKGQFAKAEMCKKGGAMMMKPVPSAYTLDKNGMCRDAKGRMAKKEMCKR